MGKRFITRSREAWEVFLVPATDNSEVGEGARQWLSDRLEGYVQTNPNAPVTLAVPDRFLAALGDALAPVVSEQQTARRESHPVR